MEIKKKSQIDNQLDNIDNLNAQYRGSIINNAINTESHLEMIISYYFTHGNKIKAEELRHCLLSQNMFSSNNKKNMFLFIIKNKYPHCKIKSVDLERIINLRNQMAHGKYVFSSNNNNEIINFDNNTITLYEWKTKNNTIITIPLKLTRTFIEKEIKHIISINLQLIELLKIIKSEYKAK